MDMGREVRVIEVEPALPEMRPDRVEPAEAVEAELEEVEIDDNFYFG